MGRAHRSSLSVDVGGDPKENGADDRDTVTRMIRAHVEAIHYFKTHKDFSLKILSKYLRHNDQELLESSYEIFKQDFSRFPIQS